jgi:hypothetical protein
MTVPYGAHELAPSRSTPKSKHTSSSWSRQRLILERRAKIIIIDSFPKKK